ncbi:class I adenylate-forming enzyme family protein [Paenibacillus tyrfis]|uniref:class I adenylate-forming enzyme family protein n=1 Tax=Paenibacillus tyrfis TaxID=1501230 RepID=UPI000B591D92|nr:class I adenylate-forming enzyme family protein [Paenibacillus tyrfis]
MLYKRIREMVENNQESPAILTDHGEISYRNFLKEVDYLVDFFQKCGLTHETPLATVLENNEVTWAVIVAASFMGVSVMLVDPNLKEEEINKIRKMYKACYEIKNITRSDVDEPESNMMYDFECFGNIFYLINIGPASRCWNKYLDLSTKQSNIVLLSSGSTKAPFAVVKTMESIVSDGERIGRTLGIKSSDRVLCAAPVYHAFGAICGCFATFLHGASVSYTGSFVLPSTLENKIQQLSCSVLMALPVHYKMLVQHAKNPLHQIRIALSSTAPLSNELLQACREKLNVNIINIYGSSEAGGVSIQQNNDNQSSNVGQPIEGVLLRFDDANYIEIDGKQVGELIIKSPSLAKGYLQIEDGGDHEFIIEDGWWRTGDLAYLNEKNELNIVGRLNITINVNGKKVNPYEIEEVLGKHPAIEDVVVVGQPDSNRGELPVAFIVLKEEVTELELLQFCRESLSDYKMPRRIEIRDALPKNSAGKVRRREVK